MSTITFITGANKGLGYETARRLIELGQTVIIGARDAGRGQAAADRLGARFVPIDVTDDGSVQRAVADVEAHEGRIDTLINNAGIIGARVAASELTGDDALLVFETNVISVVRVTNAFLPLLKRSDAPAVINVSSGMGSFALTHDPSAGRVDDRLPALHRVQGRRHDDDHPVREGDPRASGSTPPTPATPPPTSTATAATRPSPRGPTRSSPSRPRTRRPGPAGSSTASGPVAW